MRSGDKTMKNAILVLTLCLVGQGVAWAECPPGSRTRLIGSVQTANGGIGATSITGTGHDVSRVTVACAGTACVATLYDSDTDGTNNVDARVRSEPGSPASTSTTYDWDPPLFFEEGISFHDDGNVNAILAYECR